MFGGLVNSTYLKSLLVHSGNCEAIKAAIDITQGDIKESKICFFGDRGVGKTQLLLATASDFTYQNPDVKVKITDGALLKYELETFEGDSSSSKAVQQYNDADVLFINDAHKLPVTGSLEGLDRLFLQEKLFVFTSRNNLLQTPSMGLSNCHWFSAVKSVPINAMDTDGKIEFIRCFESHYKYWFSVEQKKYILDTGVSDFAGLKKICLF